jgi:hypothetical protein
MTCSFLVIPHLMRDLECVESVSESPVELRMTEGFMFLPSKPIKLQELLARHPVLDAGSRVCKVCLWIPSQAEDDGRFNSLRTHLY